MSVPSSLDSGSHPPSWTRPAGVESTSETIDGDYALASLSPERLFDVLDLKRPELTTVARAVEAGDPGASRRALLEHYRKRFERPERAAADDAILETADKITRHILQWGPYDEADYGSEIDWDWDPRGDIEWVAAMHRFYWSRPLAAAWTATGDDRYATTFVELCTDWIGKHSLEDHRRAHGVYTDWRGFVWLDLQTGIRAYNLCASVKALLHSPAFTADFLALLMASLYDHQVKTEHIPMGIIHNKAIFEQRGAVEVSTDFPEFAGARHWLEISRRRATENLLAQVTVDGVQREWSFGYHMGVLRDAVIIRDRLGAAGLPVSADYDERLRLMHEYCLAISSPFLDTPLFGDGARGKEPPAERRGADLHGFLLEAGERYGDASYAAVAHLLPDGRPEPASRAFPAAGLYALRSGWGPQDTFLSLHCSPRAISGHDQPDNGTFELAALGRWLMPDTGYFTYGHDPERRAWHRRTASHQTLTLDGANSSDDGRHLLWHTGDSGDLLVVENGSYDGLVHRRTVWFPGHRFFVFLDEAIGSAAGLLELHYQLAAGEMHLDPEALSAHTCFDDGNVLIAAAEGSAVRLEEEEGWWAWHYGHREPRPALRFRHSSSAPAVFATAVIPYTGAEPPAVSISPVGAVKAGEKQVEIEVTCSGQTWVLGRDLCHSSGWCRLR